MAGSSQSKNTPSPDFEFQVEEFTIVGRGPEKEVADEVDRLAAIGRVGVTCQVISQMLTC